MPLPSSASSAPDAHPLTDFHPAVARWFRATFPAPTAAQIGAWPAIHAGRHTLVAAPTGSGKTLTAFLTAIDALICEGLAHGGLPDETRIVYVSPLKALSNDIHINLDAPLEGIGAALTALGLPAVNIRTAVRTGDTPQAERTLMRKLAPHILVTTPESLYVLLGSASGRQMLSSTRTVIVDEIHALANSKRGAHLTLSLERLQSLCAHRLLRIGLSATQKPIDEVARFLLGAGESALPGCNIIDVGHTRDRDFAIEVPPVPLQAVMSNDCWELIYNRMAQLADEHRTTLVFVNTRRMAERLAQHLSKRLGKPLVAAHHGSLAKEQRLDAEQRLKRGELKVLVATASLELGIDIGDVDLVCQVSSPRAIATFLQRAGRSGHAVSGTPKARLFPTTRDDLVECAALLDCVRRGELDALIQPVQPLDVLAQQIVAEVACKDWDEDALYALVRRAHPYRALSRAQFDAVVRMLVDGFATRGGTRGAYVHRDAVNHQLRARRSARLTALTSGGTIPDTANYFVVLEPQATIIGTVNEDFAVESMAGDIFQLGNTSYRIQRVERDRLRVEDAHGAPPSIPFWLGEAPGRSIELSFGVSRLRDEITAQLDAGGAPAALRWLQQTLGLGDAAAQQLVEYLARSKAALGVLPTQSTLVFERFFDESGGTQLVIHSPYGSRVNRAWGLALRKRFCRQFNFELQAAATEDAIVLSLSTSHSFPLEEVSRYLHANTAEQVLVQALLDAPLFPARWRWNAVTALALPRFTAGKKTPPPLQRMKSEDLLASVFPDQVACQENLRGERQIPDHPLVNQTLHDCLREALDVDGMLHILRGLESGAITVVARDVTEPSPFAAEVLNAAPYAFLDDAPLEERRTQAVQSRRWNTAENAEDLGRLDPEAIAAVRSEAWPEVRSVDEMHDALGVLGIITAAEAVANHGWGERLQALADGRRATRLRTMAVAASAQDDDASALPQPGTQTEVWVTAENLPLLQAIHPAASMHPPIVAPHEYAMATWTRDAALRELVRSRLGGLGPVTAGGLAASLAVTADDIAHALLQLQSEGYVMQGQFTGMANDVEWCERHLLARIHRYTIGRLRREIEPVSRRNLMRFLLDWQHMTPDTCLRGADALTAVLTQMEGFEAAAGAWESEILPARVADYTSSWLDEQCRAGRVSWSRLRSGGGAGGPVRATPIVLLPRRQISAWTSIAATANAQEAPLSSRAQATAAALATRGALFFDELLEASQLLRTELEDALGELVSAGRVTADSFVGLRALLRPAGKRHASSSRRARRNFRNDIDDAGRWTLVRAKPLDQSAVPVVDGDGCGGDETSGAPGLRSPRERDKTHERGRRRAVSGSKNVPRKLAPSSAADDKVRTEAIEHIAHVLLRRYGVVFWKLLEREAGWLPSWRELVRVYHRLEARGEIRGGRFVEGIVGEQFALPEAIGQLRSVRKRPHDNQHVIVSGSDPLNLVGTVLVGTRLPALARTRVLYEDGAAVAALVANKPQYLVEGDTAMQQVWRNALLRRSEAPRV